MFQIGRRDEDEDGDVDTVQRRPPGQTKAPSGQAKQKRKWTNISCRAR